MDLIFSNSNTRNWVWINAFNIWKKNYFLTKNSLPSQTCSRKHWKTYFPIWRTQNSTRDSRGKEISRMTFSRCRGHPNQTEQWDPRERYVEGCHHRDPSWANAWMSPGSYVCMLSFTTCWWKSWLSPVFLHLPHLSTFISPPSVFYSWGLEVGTGDLTEQPTSSDYIPAGGPILDPHFSSAWCAFCFPSSHSYSVTAGKVVKLFGKLKLDLPQPDRILFSWEPLSERGSTMLFYLAGLHLLFGFCINHLSHSYICK